MPVCDCPDCKSYWDYIREKMKESAERKKK